MNYNFPIIRVACERCHENYMEYLGHALVNGTIHKSFIVLCSDCIIKDIVEFKSAYKIKLKWCGLPILITQAWDESERGLVPITRIKGGLFNV